VAKISPEVAKLVEFTVKSLEELPSFLEEKPLILAIN
jgi:hypothetical protein